MLRALLMGVLAVAAGFGQYVELTQGNLKLFVFKYSSSVPGLPVMDRERAGVMVGIKTDDAATDAFKVTIQHKDSFGLIWTTTEVIQRRRTGSAYSPVVFEIGKVTVLSVLVEELKASQSQNFKFDDADTSQ